MQPRRQDSRQDFIVKKAKSQKSSDNFALKWSLITILVSVLISFGIVFALNADFIPTEMRNKLAKNVENVPVLSALTGRQNILLLGVDSNGNPADPFTGSRSDTIIVLNLDPVTKTANAISIPRDSKVYLANNNGVDKINAAHAIGGPRLTVKTVEETFGIKIHHYIAINYEGIKELVDAVGGVPLTVEKRMRYRDRAGRLNINLYPGYQVLNSEEAIGYLRFRHDAIGDIGRTRRQQNFIKSLVKKLQSPEMVVKIPQLVQLATKYIRTDMNFYDLSRVVGFSRSVNLDNVQVSTLPGKPSRFGRISYWILDAEKVQEIIDRLIYREELSTSVKLTLSLVYAPDLENKITEIKSALENSGYQIVCDTRNNRVSTEIISHSKFGTLKSANAIRKIIPALDRAQFSLAPDRYLCGESDLTLVLSGNN